jgi:hypothetical protein
LTQLPKQVAKFDNLVKSMNSALTTIITFE